jgi:two-component system sensor histidine kinase/response regulator
MVRDLTRLILADKIENENKFFNKLTATVSHEMMTPLSCIITIAKSV